MQFLKETTSDTILWCIIHLMLNPKIQQKLHEELDNVVGKNKLITVQEKPMLPFTQAVINVRIEESDLSNHSRLGMESLVEGRDLLNETFISPHRFPKKVLIRKHKGA